MNNQSCPHFGLCGGCTFLDVPYQQQLSQKENIIKEALTPFSPGEIRPIIPSPCIYYYRNKMEYAFGPDFQGHLSLGLRKRKSFMHIVDVENCLLMSEASNEVLKIARAWGRDNSIPAYNRKTHQGILRYLVIREGKKTSDMLIYLISTTDLEEPLARQLAENIKSRFPEVTTFLWGKHSTKSDVARTDTYDVFWGNGCIEDIIGDIKFKISPYSFFQTNTYATQELYDTINNMLDEAGCLKGRIFDLYCGGGGISLYIAKKAREVIGIELNPDAVADAIENAERNGLNNVKFLQGEVEKVFPSFHVEDKDQFAGVVDPPRPGLHPKALECLLELKLPHLIYVSCNPKALVSDLEALRNVYSISAVQPLDLFPHTPHQETVVSLRRT